MVIEVNDELMTRRQHHCHSRSPPLTKLAHATAEIAYTDFMFGYLISMGEKRSPLLAGCAENVLDALTAVQLQAMPGSSIRFRAPLWLHVRFALAVSVQCDLGQVPMHGHLASVFGQLASVIDPIDEFTAELMDSVSATYYAKGNQTVVA